MEGIDNIENVGFQKGEALDNLIRQPRFSVCPSECYENCPFSVMESQIRGTVVIGANIGGIPELITDGENGMLFPSGDADALADTIYRLWNDRELLRSYEQACRKLDRDDVKSYADKVLALLNKREE